MKNQSGRKREFDATYFLVKPFSMNLKAPLRNVLVLISLGCCLFFFSCELGNQSSKIEKPRISQKEVTQIWKLADIDLDTGAKDDTDVLINDAVNNVFLEKGLMMCFFPNGDVSELLGYKFQQGRWRITSDKTAIEVDKKGTKDTLKILDLSQKKGKSYLTVEYAGVGKMEFMAIQSMLENYEEDPFYPDNNQWRIRPKSEETELELKQRLKNYVRHTTLILKAALERDSDIISFEHSQGIIKIYQGGIGIVKQKNVPEEWAANFFNEEQAMLARKFYRAYLLAGTYKGASSGSWVADDYKILAGLYKRIDDDLKEKEVEE
jgi:hypothetical protein